MQNNSSEWNEQYEFVSNMVRKLKTDIDPLEQKVNQINAGIATDAQMRSNTTNKIHQLIQVAKDLSEEIRSLTKLTYGEPERSNQLMQLENRAVSEASRLQRLSRSVQINFRQQTDSQRARSQYQPFSNTWQSGKVGSGDGSVGMPSIPPPSQTSTEPQLQLQFVDDEATQAQLEDERAMRVLEDDILKVNEIFSTLAGFVHEQGALVDSIEAQTETAHVQVQAASYNLSRAVRHRNSSRRKKIICVIVVVVVILIIALILGLSLR